MTLSIEKALQEAVHAHNQGSLQDAERGYRSILRSQPSHPDANHNLAVLAMSVNQIADALPLFKVALEGGPQVEQYWLSYIDALIRNRKMTEAKLAIGTAKKNGFDGEKFKVLMSHIGVNSIETAPSQQQLNNLNEFFFSGRYADAESLAISISQEFPTHQFSWKILGALFGQTGRSAQAVDFNRKSVALSPNDAEAHCNLASCLKDLGEFKDAEASYRQAIKLRPDFVGAHLNLANMLISIDRFEEAEGILRGLIKLEPTHAEAYFTLGNMFKDMHRFVEAEASYRQAIGLQCDHTKAYINLGTLLIEQSRHDEAAASYLEAIRYEPECAEAHYNLGTTLMDLGRVDEAEVSLTQAIVFKSDFVEAHYNLGNALLSLERLDEAKEKFQQAISFSPHFTEARMNLGTVLMELGEHREGLNEKMRACGVFSFNLKNGMTLL